MHKQLKRITDYDKNLPIVEIYTAVQSEGSRSGYPTVVIRTTGCTHRCYFGEGGWCDSWYTSIHPEKGKFSFNNQGGITDERMIKTHNRLRLNYEAIKQSIEYHSDFHIKPVWDGKDEKALAEIMNCIKLLNVSKDKVWFMPAGDSRESLFKSYPVLFDWVRDNGYRMTWRPHIIAFEDQREV
jgi:hypothetical protein